LLRRRRDVQGQAISMLAGILGALWRRLAGNPAAIHGLAR
jgi:hypothetical protein